MNLDEFQRMLDNLEIMKEESFAPQVAKVKKELVEKVKTAFKEILVSPENMGTFRMVILGAMSMALVEIICETFLPEDRVKATQIIIDGIKNQVRVSLI